jgi:AraC family transcriptional regulator
VADSLAGAEGVQCGYSSHAITPMQHAQDHAIAHSTGVQSRKCHLQQSGGVSAEATDWHCDGQSYFDLTCSRYRLGFVLEQSSGFCETRTNPRVRGGYVHGGRPFLTFSPPDMRVWACSDEIRFTRSLSIAFDWSALVERLGEDSEGVQLSARFNLEDSQLCPLAQMLAAECRSPGPFGTLYSDSLTNAILIGLVRLGAPTAKARHRLAPTQLRIAIDYMDARKDGGLLLSDLAAATGLSQSHFSRAFKASTGLPPYQWHLQCRISRAQELLLNSPLSVVQIAAVTGFADQPHFTRAFRHVTRTTPAAWRKDRLAE